MKAIIVLIVISVIFYSCEGSCVEYIIENKTSKNLELVKYSKDSIGVNNQITEIFANSDHAEMNDCGLGKGVLGYDNDSIQMKANGVLVKTYYPNDVGKSIFKTDPKDDAFYSWKLVDFKRDYEKYVFEITEEDLK